MSDSIKTLSRKEYLRRADGAVKVGPTGETAPVTITNGTLVTAVRCPPGRPDHAVWSPPHPRAPMVTADGRVLPLPDSSGAWIRATIPEGWVGKVSGRATAFRAKNAVGTQVAWEVVWSAPNVGGSDA